MQSNSLYIGDLEQETNEDTLRNFFEKKAPGVNIGVKVCLDHYNPHKSLGYGYLNFDTPAEAQRILDELNYSELKPNGRAFRLMWRQPGIQQRQQGGQNLCVKNLPENYTSKMLHDLFKGFGSIMSSKVSLYKRINAGKHGFVHFTKKEDGDKALQEMNKKIIDGNEIIVEGSRPFDEYSHQTCFIDQINPETTEEDIRAALDNVKDSIVRVVLKKNNQIQGGENQTLRAILVYLNSKDVADQVAHDYNGTEIKGAKVRVAIARSKWERQQYKRKLRESTRYKNIYIKGFPLEYTDDQLKDLFSKFGKITSCVAMKSGEGASRGFGFCCFEDESSAKKALQEMKDFPIGPDGQQLVVDYAQNKAERPPFRQPERGRRNNRDNQYGDDRRQYNKFSNRKNEQQQQQQDQNQNNQPNFGGLLQMLQLLQPLAQNMSQNPFGQMPPYPFGGPGQQFTPYIQPNMGMNQQFPFPGMNPNLVNQQNIPFGGMLNQQGQPRNPVNMSNQPFPPQHNIQMQQQIPQQQQQLLHQQQQLMQNPINPAQIPGAVPGPHIVPQPPPNLQQQIPPIPIINQQAVAPNPIIQPIQPPVPQQFNPQILAQIPSDQQKQYIGEFLYAKISTIDEPNAGKITGMLLELDIGELINILGNDQQLNQKTREAQRVLREAVTQ